MPIDYTRLPALRQELIYSKQVKAGGQEPDPGRVAAIEEQIKLHEKAEREAQKAQREPSPADASNASTDYESHDADAKDTKAKKPSAKRAEAEAKAKDEEPE